MSGDKPIFRKPDENKSGPDPFAEQRAYFAHYEEKYRQEMESQRRNSGAFKYRHSNRLAPRRRGLL